MSGRTIEIDILLNDKTNGRIKGIQKDLQALDKQAERLNQRIKAVGLQKFAATLRLIDRVTEPASRINSLLKKIAGGTYRVTMRLNDSALAGIRKIESALLRISGRAYNIAVNVKGAAMNKLNGMMSGALMGAGVFAPMAGMMGVGYGVGNAISSAASFEQQMSKVQAIRQLSKDSAEMKALTQQAKDLGMQTAWTRQQVGEAQYYQALAGWETPQILKATPHMLNLASAGGMDLGAASDMLTDAMTAFGLKATDQYTNAKGQAIDLPEYFADMFAKVQASSNTNLYQLQEATKYSASTIGTMFANIGGQEGVQARTEAARQMLIMAGLMANAGIKGSMAGTGINTIFNRLAGENRNTHFAEKLLGLEHAAENGNMLMPLDFIKAFRNKIQGGMSVDDFMTVAEELSGEKIHADTRRKINSTIENALKNGGKLGSSDMLKIGSMMAGLENAPKLMAMVFQDIEALEAKMNNVEGTAGQMAETMLDNLAGSFTKLGSAWDAFQQDLFTGTAGDGLRNFVDALTEILTRANNLFKDGIQIADFGKIIGDVVGRLKDKAMELDGIGSLLAGGALVMGLKKIISLGQSALNVFKGVGAAGATALGGAAAKGAAGAAAGMSVSTMNVKAGVVNLAGAVKGGYGYGGGGRGGYGYGGGAAGAAASPMAAMLAAQKQLDKANAQLLSYQTKRDAKWGRVEQLFAAGKSDSQLAQARATARKFDETRYLPALERQQAAQKALVAARVNAYNEEIARQKQMIALAREQGQLQRSSIFAGMKSAAGGAAAFAGLFSLLDVMSLKSANAERLAAAPEDQRAQIMIENRKAEWEASVGGLGAVVGAAAGAALGSLAGPMGTMIGGIVGSAIGEKLGQYFGDKGAEREVARTSNVSQDEIRKRVAGYKPETPPDYSFGQKPVQTNFDEYGDLLDAGRRMSHNLATVTTATAKTIEDYGVALENELAAKKAAEDLAWAKSRDFTFQWQGQNSAFEYYQQRAAEMAANPANFIQPKWGNVAHAAELNEEQMAQMAAMEGGTVASKVMAPFEMTEAGTPPEMPDITGVTEQIYSDLEALQEGVGEVFSGFGEQITEQLTVAFEGVGETFATFGTTITEGLTSTFDGVNEMFATFGTTISEGLTTTFTGAGEQFAQFGTMISEGMMSAQTAAESSMTAIQTVFTTTKDTIQAAWGELPAFFANVFSGLGGAAAAAGAAIEAGLTAPIGSIIGAWQGAAAQISSIISSISAQAAAMPSIPTGGGNIPAHAEGGFITSPEFALIGERGAELILPLTDKERSHELLRQASGVLGLNSEEDGYSISSGGSGGSGSISISVGGVTVNFEINGSDSTNVMEAIKENLQEIGDKVAAQISKSVGNVFQNQMVVA